MRPSFVTMFWSWQHLGLQLAGVLFVGLGLGREREVLDPQPPDLGHLDGDPGVVGQDAGEDEGHDAEGARGPSW